LDDHPITPKATLDVVMAIMAPHCVYQVILIQFTAGGLKLPISAALRHPSISSIQFVEPAATSDYAILQFQAATVIGSPCTHVQTTSFALFQLVASLQETSQYFVRRRQIICRYYATLLKTRPH